jgi:ligand-binding sensor domain-containing protein
MRLKKVLAVGLAAVFSTMMIVSCQQENQCDGSKDKDEEHGLVVAQELSNSRVQAIEEDATGQLWIATFRGLNRYDGHE